MVEQQATYRDPTENDFPDDYDQSKVDSRVAIRAKAVREKQKGVDVRGALAQGVEIASVDASEAKTDATRAVILAQDMQDRWDTQINGKVDPSEVVDARQPLGGNAYKTLNERIEAGVDDRSKNVKAFGVVGDGETDDTQAIKKIIENANDGDTYFFPTGNYKVSENIQIDKRLNLQGVKPVYQSGDLVRGTVIRGGGGVFFVDGSSGSSVTGIGVVVAKGFTNGFDIRGILSGITIRDCLTIAQEHGYLIESYLGLISDVTVENCEAHDSIHGFISKATRTTFDSCVASGIQYWGFGAITDNIPGSNKVGSAINNRMINCRAVKCGVGFSQYKRNYFETGEDAVPCLGNQFIGCTAESCNNSLSIGDTPGDTGNGKYVTYPVDNTIISAFTEILPASNTRLLFSRNLAVSGIVLDKKADLSNDSAHNNPGLTVSGVSGAKLGTWFDIQPLSTGDNPSVKYGRFFRTANTTSTVITQLANIVDGQTYTITLWDDQTRIQQSTMIKLQGGTVYGRGNSIQLRAQDGVLFELNRTVSANTALQVNYANASGFEAGQYNFIEIVASGSDSLTNLIKVNNPDAKSAMITVLIRATDGAIKPAGFDPSEFVIPGDNDLVNFAHSLVFGTGLMTQWAYTPSIGKYVLISSQLVPYV